MLLFERMSNIIHRSIPIDKTIHKVIWLDIVMMEIFFFCRQSPANMALWFIDVQYLANLCSQCRIYLPQPFRAVFMYRRLADSIFLCCLTYCRIMLYNIICDFNRSFFNITFQKKPLQSLLLDCMQGFFHIWPVNALPITFIINDRKHAARTFCCHE